MSSATSLQALQTILPGLFKKYTSGTGSLAAFMALAPINSHKGQNGAYQQMTTKLGYNAQLGNVGEVSDSATRGLAPMAFTEVNFTHTKHATDWIYVDDRVAEALNAPNPDLDVFSEALEYVEAMMCGYLHVKLEAAIDALSTYGTALDLTDTTTKLSSFLRTFSDTQALTVGPRQRPNTFGFGPQAYTLILELDEVREAASNIGTVYPTAGVVDSAAFHGQGNPTVAPAVQAVCARAGVTPVLVDESYINAAGSDAWIFTTKGFLGHSAAGSRPSCLKTFSPYDALIDVVTGRLNPPALPGDAYLVRSEYALETVDTNLGKEVTLTLS